MENYEGMMIFENDIYRFNDERTQLISVATPWRSYSEEWTLDLKDLHEEADRYAGFYNWVAQKFENMIDGYEPYWWVFVHLSKNFVVNGDKMSAGEIDAINAYNIEYNNSPVIIDQEVSNLLNGKAPELEIDGQTYIADGVKREVYRKDNPEIKFCFPGNDIHYPQKFFYNRREKMPCNVDYKGVQFPDADVVALKLPSLYEMDPFGYHRDDPTHVLIHCVHMLKSSETNLIEIIPFEQTNTAAWIRKNQLEKENTPSKGKTPRKGKHMF